MTEKKQWKPLEERNNKFGHTGRIEIDGCGGVRVVDVETKKPAGPSAAEIEAMRITISRWGDLKK